LWADHGYIVLDGLFDGAVLDDVWTRYEHAVQSGKITLAPEPASEGYLHPGRYLNPHKKVGAFCRILKSPELLGWLELLTGRQPKALQTITSHKGTQQAVHSDSIHMTTYPLGYLTAAWIAFDDIHPDSGPLVYYPGSHKLPYTFSAMWALRKMSFARQVTVPTSRNMSRSSAKFRKRPVQPAYFHARKGDVLIWHANLLHGGSVRRNMELKRRAVVCYFFAKGAFVYHDLAATRSKQQYMSTCLLRDETGKLSLPGRR